MKAATEKNKSHMNANASESTANFSTETTKARTQSSVFYNAN